MFFDDIVALAMSDISLNLHSLTKKGFLTPFAKITKFTLKTPHPILAESKSFFCLQGHPRVTDGKIVDPEIRALVLTAKAIKDCTENLPVETHEGFANMIRLSETEFIIVAVIADKPDAATFCNHITKVIADIVKTK